MTLSAIEALQSLRALLVNNPKVCVEVPDPLTINVGHEPRTLEIKLVDMALAELQAWPEGRAGGDSAMLHEQGAGLPRPALKAVSTGADPR